ncbi:MAG: hypothetical protein R3D27_03890 [Hyphomicrobiaceae bacterium]
MNMKLNRRSFFGVAAVSPMSAKEIARKVVEEAQMSASGISYYSDSIYTGVPVSDDPTPTMKSLWDVFKEVGVPEWKRDDLREDAKRNRTLDPDIAGMKSVSLNMKMQMQWERNYERLVQRAIEQQQMARDKRKWFDSNPNVSEY